MSDATSEHAAINALLAGIGELQDAIDGLKTTLHEDLEYQRKLEDRLEAIRVATDEGWKRHDPVFDPIRDILKGE